MPIDGATDNKTDRTGFSGMDFIYDVFVIL